MDFKHSIEISNIGPIDNVQISLNGLSIIVGPNKSGKSTITLMLFIVRNTLRKYFDYLFDEILRDAYYKDMSENLIEFAKSLNEIRNSIAHGKSIKNDQKNDLQLYLKELTMVVEQEFVNKNCQTKFAGIFVGEIQDAFQDKIYNLIKTGENRARLKYENLRLSVEIELTLNDEGNYVIISIKEFSTKEITISKNLKILSDENRPSLTIEETNNGLKLSEINIEDIPYVSSHARSNLKSLTTFLGDNDMVFLPPGRNLVMQNFSFFNSIGLDRFTNRQLPSQLIEFLFKLNQSLSVKSFTKKSKPNHAKYFEEKLLEGRINSKSRTIYDQLIFEESNLKTPIERAAAMIQDLAAIPLILFNENINDLIIEEPEAHLHPHAQLKFASWLTRYVNYKTDLRQPTNILVTTHSPNLVMQIQNFISAFKLGEVAMENKIFSKEELLNPDLINLYRMKPSESGYSSEFVKTELKGFEKEVFGDVTDKLYKQYMKITKLRSQR